MTTRSPAVRAGIPAPLPRRDGRCRAARSSARVLGVLCGHAGQCAHLRVAQLAATHRRRDRGQRLERAGDAHLLACRAEVDA
ncbi:MAG: hypothetical protein ACK559_34530, partial [bacterium]